MEVEHLFGGSALRTVDGDGRVSLPAFIRAAIERRSGQSTIVMSPHESDPCLSAYDPSYPRILLAEVERRRLSEELSGAAATHHHERSRRLFGMTETATFNGSGSFVIPAIMRRKGGIEALALFVGVGPSFEIWNPHIARDGPDQSLRELASYRLEKSHIGHEQREDVG
jgi:MraZ protein